MQEPPDGLKALLDPDEQVVWWGAPLQGLRFRKQDVFLIPFSLAWAGFAIFWLVNVIQIGAPFVFVLAGFIALGAGLYLVVGRFFRDAKRRQNTAYAVTSKRLLISRKGRLSSIDLTGLDQIHLEQNRDGTESIIFGNDEPAPYAAPTRHVSVLGMGSRRHRRLSRISRPRALAFEFLEDGASVLAMIRQARDAACTSR